ncbi:MAG: twin-arginine translocase subunit TatB [Rhodospirillaceae bacterium]|nr:twin-arginine translocase subunit TatB [Rhodospirillaceae bacterium]MCA8931221.1 twin-arginine translocase subunit TatB [Rhodospirillaceae bacterium]
MLDVGWPEFTIIVIIAIVVIGPRDLPRALNTVGKWVRKARTVTREFQRHIDDMVKESELEELRELRKLNLSKGNIAKQIGKEIDPTGEMKKSLESARNIGKPGEAPEEKAEAALDEAKKAELAAEMDNDRVPLEKEVAAKVPQPAAVPGDEALAQKPIEKAGVVGNPGAPGGDADAIRRAKLAAAGQPPPPMLPKEAARPGAESGADGAPAKTSTQMSPEELAEWRARYREARSVAVQREPMIKAPSIKPPAPEAARSDEAGAAEEGAEGAPSTQAAN